MREIRLCDDASLNRVYNLCEQNKLGLEIQGFYNPALIGTQESNRLLNEYKESLINFKGGKSLHAPFWDLNLGSKNAAVREATMKAFNYAYEVAKELGCTEIVVHNGFVPNTSFYEGWVRNATAFWKDFFSDKDDSITMMIENQCEEDSEVLKMEFDSVNDSRLKVCLDIGHAHANSNMKVEDWITSLGERIGYLHLHNNHSKVSGRPSYLNDEHLGLDMGTINIKNVLELLELNCPDAIWNIECKLDYIESSVNVLKENRYLK
jgi:sugar phosphate isomerase/epimerase